MDKLFQKINKCRISKDKKLKLVCDFGKIKLTGIFPSKPNSLIPETPLQVMYSEKSKLLQLNHNYNFNNLFGSNYGYRSGLNNSMINHLKQKSEKLKKKIKLENGDKILDIGSNDGTFLNFFSKNIIREGCDPTSKKFKKFYNKGIKIYSKIFDKKIKEIFKSKYKLISSIAMFYDLKNPIEFCKNVEKILDEKGIFHVEIAYLPDILRTYSFDTFCQEHLTYFSLISFENLLKNTNLRIIDYSRNNINGGSINFDIVLNKSSLKTNIKKMNKLRKYENKFKLGSFLTYKNYFFRVQEKINLIENKIKKISQKEDIYGFGASTKGNVTLQLCNLNYNNIKAIYDINREKFGCFTPGSKIPIVNEKKIYKDKPKNIILLIWHFKKTIKQKIKKLKLSKSNLIWLFPSFKITKGTLK